jgi:hypothetical protein
MCQNLLVPASKSEERWFTECMQPEQNLTLKILELAGVGNRCRREERALRQAEQVKSAKSNTTSNDNERKT